MLLCCSALGLGPQQIALVVNRNNPDSLKLALAYAAARGIPDGRIISLDVPDAEEISFDDYERNVVPPIRTFLRVHGLRGQVTCLVTFYGVPFRIRDRIDTDDEKTELADLKTDLADVINEIRPLVLQEEQLARSLDPGFMPLATVAGDSDVHGLESRYRAALQSIGSHFGTVTSPAEHQRVSAQLLNLISRLGGVAEALEYTRAKDAPATQEWQSARVQVAQASRQILGQEERRFDPVARAAVRKLVTRYFGLLQLGDVTESQIDYLTPGLTNSALDNELALLWLRYYPRNNYWINPLYYRSTAPIREPIVMVSRLDGPDPDTVARMIKTTIQVEGHGLHGFFAINSYGFPDHLAPDGRNMYKEYEQRFRDLSQLVMAHTEIPVRESYTGLFQNREIGPTALYCGWYSLRRYVPGMRFSPGAVGYHVASLEMVALHDRGEPGWVHGLLSDGVVATVGPVAEPYLIAFPSPNEFFPLLLTGKLTLAEVYWKTEQLTSWMMCLIGDPLYTPFKVNPALRPEDLPPDLQTALGGRPPASNSSSRGQ
jgi:uncharacterized protein (TIGR03790 family)